jgi:hypothetical protein
MSDRDTSTFFPALADFLSPLNGQASEQSPSLSVTPSAKKSSRNIGRASRFTETSANSQDEVSSQSPCSQVDFLVSHSVLPGSKEARQMTAISGQKCSELFKRQTPIGSLVRTLLASTDWASTIVFLTWKPAATKSRRRLKFQLAVWEPSTDETESGLLPTATVCGNFNRKGASPTSGDGIVTALKRQAGLLPTATRSGSNLKRPTTNGQNISLTTGERYGLDLCQALKIEAGMDGLQNQNGFNTNPDWLDWFMGYPVGHTEPEEKSQETQSCPKSRIKSSKPSSPKSKKKNELNRTV